MEDTQIRPISCICLLGEISSWVSSRAYSEWITLLES